jgi:hypothetical protein
MANARSGARGVSWEAYPSHVLFEERDGIFWLRGANLERARKVFCLSSGPRAVGFDRETAAWSISHLLNQHVKVGIIQNGIVRIIPRRQSAIGRKAVPVVGTSIDLAPDVLFGKRELERLALCLTKRSGAHLAELVERIEAEGLTSPVTWGEAGCVPGTRRMLRGGRGTHHDSSRRDPGARGRCRPGRRDASLYARSTKTNARLPRPFTQSRAKEILSQTRACPMARAHATLSADLGTARAYFFAFRPREAATFEIRAEANPREVGDASLALAAARLRSSPTRKAATRRAATWTIFPVLTDRTVEAGRCRV